MGWQIRIDSQSFIEANSGHSGFVLNPVVRRIHILAAANGFIYKPQILSHN
jgi:hypothetical protein